MLALFSNVRVILKIMLAYIINFTYITVRYCLGIKLVFDLEN